MIGALVGRYHAQQQMHRQLDAGSEPFDDEGAVQHLTFSRAERQSTQSSFRWVEEREFRYRGNLFDIVREEWRGDTWHVWAVHDKEEEHYLDVLAQSTHAPLAESATVPVEKVPVVLRPLALVPSEAAPIASPLLRVRPFPRPSSIAYQAPYLEVPHPPPWG